jgi:hypothetical protein
MTRRVRCVGLALVAALTTGCGTVTGTPVAAPVAATTTVPPTTTTTEPTTTTQAPPTPPKPRSPRTVQVGSGTSLRMAPAYQMAFVQVQDVHGGEVTVVGEWAPGSAGSFQCYDSCDLSAGEYVSIGGMHAGATASLNNLVIVVDSVHGGHAQLTIGTLH